MIAALVILSAMVAFLACWETVLTIRLMSLVKEQRQLEALVVQHTSMSGSQAAAMKQMMDTLGQFKESITLIAKGGIELTDRVGVIEGEINERRRGEW